MKILNSTRRVFSKPNGEEKFVGRFVEFVDEEENEQEEFIPVDELGSDIEYQELEDYIENNFIN